LVYNTDTLEEDAEMSRYLDLKELAEELDDLRARAEYADENPEDDDAEPLDDDERRRLADLEALESDLGDLHIASRDVSPIHEFDFEDYAADMAVNTGMISEEMLPYLDRERWANDAQTNYSSFEFEGETYYYS